MANQSSNVIVAWPLSDRWVLEETAHLQSPVPWSLVAPQSYQSNTTMRFVSVPSGEGSRFFRLRKIGLTVPGLMGYWGLDEGNGQVSEDGTSSGSALLLTNAAWGSGRLGPGALRFNGSAAGPIASRAWVSNDNYRVLPPGGNPFSFSLWLNPDSLPVGWSGIAGNNSTGTNGWQVALNNAGPGTNFFIFSSAGLPNSLSITGRFLLLPGQWHQLTVTHDGTEGSIYLDSALLARGSGSLQTHDGVVNFGGGLSGLNSFLGRIDDLRLYTNCLSHEQIALTGDWRFDEPSGQVCADSSIQARTALITNAAARVEGHNGMGIDLSKSSIRILNDDYAVLPPNGGAFSVSFWIKPNRFDTGKQGLLKLGEGPIGGWELAVVTESAGQTSLSMIATNAGGTLDLLAKVPFAAGNWTKIDITFNGGIATLYANGKQLRAESGAIRGTKAPLLIGAVPGLPSFDGVIDDLKIYSRERGPSEIGPIAATMWETVMWNSSTNMQLQGSGPPGRTLTYAIVPIITPTNGTVTLSSGSSEFTYVAGSRKGPDAFTYTVSDGEFTSDPAIVTMSVVEPHYLSPTGGWLEPFDGTSPMQAWLAGPADAMDAILKTNNYYDCFFYAPGEYETRGWKYLERTTANPGCKHIGSGVNGLDSTRLKLVDIWSAWTEESIFGIDGFYLCDGFEVHSMVLDCNAQNVPKYKLGEPAIIRIPLAAAGRVEQVTLHWDNTTFYGNTYSRIGQAADLKLLVRRAGTNTFTANYNAADILTPVQVFDVGTEADELLLELTHRAANVDFYGLKEISIVGSKPSLPTARQPSGETSQLTNSHSILYSFDGNPGTAWASGPERNVEIMIPLEPGTTVTQITLEWYCKNLVGTGRFGPAASYTLRARDELSGAFYDVPFTSSGRTSKGSEICRFGTSDSPTSVKTDRFLLTLASKESSIDFYGLKEINLSNNSAPIPVRLPTASSTLNWGLSTHILKAFDGDTSTQWACGIQGMVGAIKAAGNNQKYSNLKIVGFGTKAGRECFPMFLSVAHAPGGPRKVGNVLVEDCILTQPATNNSDGLTSIVLAAVYPDVLTNAILRRCTVADVKPYFVYSVGMTAKNVENCVVTNCGKGVYFEPNSGSGESVGEVIVRSNRFYNVSHGINLLMFPATAFDSLTCLNNEVVLADNSSGWGASVCDTCFGGRSAVVSNLTVLNNVIRYSNWLEQPGRLEGGLFYSDTRHAVFANNLIILGTPNGLRVRQHPASVIVPLPPEEDCDNPGPFPPGNPSYEASMDPLRPGYRRAWFNNRDLSGRPLEVRFNTFGTDVPASEQQWIDPFISP